MRTPTAMHPRERLVRHVTELERLEALKAQIADDFKDAMTDAKAEGFDGPTLKAILKLRKMTPEQRRDKRALEAIYMASLGMLEGDSLPDEARRRLDGTAEPPQPPTPPPTPEPAPYAPPAPDAESSPAPTPAAPPEQPPLIVKDPAEARQEGADAAAAGKRVFDNPYRAGDPCRAAWDEGWCSQQKSHGMETPAAYQRRSQKPPKKDDDDKGQGGSGDVERGAA